MYDVDVFYTLEKCSTAAAKSEKPIRPVIRLVAMVYFMVSMCPGLEVVFNRLLVQTQQVACSYRGPILLARLSVRGTMYDNGYPTARGDTCVPSPTPQTSRSARCMCTHSRHTCLWRGLLDV